MGKVRLQQKFKRFTRSKLYGLFYLNGKLATMAGMVILAGATIGLGAVYKNTMTPKIDQAAYTPLLNTIAKGESKGNYNAYFGNASNTTIRFTDMSIGEVLKWQDDYVRQGSVSSAVGKYQIINKTLRGLVRELKVDTTQKFDEAMQDRMAIALLERRGSEDYARDKLSREQFAANLAKEWAALPKITGDNPEQSYYGGDGINKVQISIEEIFTAVATIKSK